MQAVGEATHTTPTGKETLIDWALVSQVTQLKQCEVIPPIANSDHNGLMLQWAWKQPGNRNKTKPRQIWRYTQGDFERANNILSSVDWDQLIDPTDVNQSLLNWEQYFMNVMNPVYRRVCFPGGKMFLGFQRTCVVQCRRGTICTDEPSCLGPHSSGTSLEK